jgi:pimeloyl-ACP methyl ester carboxylesterase
VVTYDQRGHGASVATADYSLDAFLADLQAMRDALALDQPLLVGHSFGGLLAVEYAATHPSCAGVVGVDGGLKIERPPIGWEEVQMKMTCPPWRRRAMSRGRLVARRAWTGRRFRSIPSGCAGSRHIR